MVHDTRNPLTCCPRCRRAELGWRAGRRPVFRYARADAAEAPLYCRVFHGDQAVASVSRPGRTPPYEVTIDGGDDRDLRQAATLRDARQLADAAYTALWRDGVYPVRGPVHAP